MLAPNHYFPPFSEQEYKRRYAVLSEAMKESGLDCLVIYGATPLGGNDTGQINAQYLSNFAGVGHTYVVFPVKEAPTLHIGMALHIRNAQDISPIQDVRIGVELEDTVSSRLRELSLNKANIGIVGPAVSYFMPCTIPYEHYTRFLNDFPEAEFRNVTEWYENIRSIKSEEEIELIDRAAALNDLCHEELLHAARPGISHADLRRIVEQVAFMHKGNHCMMHLSSWPMLNQDWPYPDFWPTDRTVEAGHLVMTEMPVGYGMYYTKLMHTFFLGEPTREYRDMFELAASVHERVIRELKPGMKGSDVDKFIEPIKEAGYMATGLVSGWCNYNSPPFVGQTHPEFPQKPKQSHLDLVFKPGLCVQVMAYPIAFDLKKGLWVGSTCIFTKDGLRELNKYPVRKLRVA
ncbi:MAG: M24 family metallopeptidase [Thermodesulfobacteriota bacterium]